MSASLPPVANPLITQEIQLVIIETIKCRLVYQLNIAVRSFGVDDSTLCDKSTAQMIINEMKIFLFQSSVAYCLEFPVVEAFLVFCSKKMGVLIVDLYFSSQVPAMINDVIQSIESEVLNVNRDH